MSESTETTPQPTTNSGPEPGSMEDWGAPEPGERRLPPLEPESEPHQPDPPPVEGDDTSDPPPAKADAEDDPIGDDPESEGEDDAPEFWSKEDKAFWKQVPPELKPVLQKYDKLRLEFVNKKAEEAAAERKKAMEEAQKAAGASEEYLKWWQANGERFAQTFVDKWAKIDFKRLAEENPAEWARLTEERADEHRMLQHAHRQAEAARAETESRAKAAHQEARLAEHGKLAAEFPREFGTPEAAKRTYEALGAYLQKQGFPPERINNVYEANLVKMVRKAYKYDQLQAKAKEVTSPKPPAASASTTPMRVVPGARTDRANQVNEASRQALERLNSGAPSSSFTKEEAGLMFR